MSVQNEVLIRVDGSQQIGHGHLARCLSMAFILQEKFTVTFVCEQLPEGWNQQIEAQFNLIMIRDHAAFFDLIRENQVVIADGYQFNAEFQKEIKNRKGLLVLIDDLHQGKYFADLIINTAPGVLPTDYLAQSYTHYALGINYVLLRPEFLALAQQQVAHKPRTAFICFGGSDPSDLTRRACDVALESGQFDEIHVVTGSSYLHTDALHKRFSKRSGMRFHHAVNASQMAELMAHCEIAIVPASGILHEAIAAGCKPVSGYYVDNQKDIYNNYLKLNCIIDAGKFETDQLTKALRLVNTAYLNKAIIDGFSGKRLLDKILKLSLKTEISFRKVNMDDIDLTYNWARNSQIRRYAFTQHLITAQEHHIWLSKKMVDKNCAYFIIEYKQVPIGSIRFDIINNHAIISYLADANLHGKGFGKAILSMGIEQFEQYARENNVFYNKIIGYVKHDNQKSLYIFNDLNFKAQHYKNFTKFTYNLPSRNTMKVGLMVSGVLGFTCMKQVRVHYEVPFVFTDRASRNIIRYCEENEIPVFIGNPRNQPITSFLSQAEIDVLFSINYLFLIGQELISKPKLYTLNIHGSLLPKYRGRTPHVWSIINGEKSTGITVHKIDLGCDTGDIVYQQRIPILETSTGGELLKIFKKRYPGIVMNILERIRDKGINSRKQDESKASYFEKRTPEDGKIDWNLPSKQIINWVRALSYPYPGAFTYYGNKKIIIDRISKVKGHRHKKNSIGEIISISPELLVRAGDGVLRIDRIRNKNITFEVGMKFRLS